MSRISQLLSAALLVVLLSLTAATPAYAFDGRGGDTVIIPSGDTINDDLYVGANQFVLDGTVNGDTVAFGQIVTVNGTINGDLITAAQTVVVNGTVTGNIRMAGSVLFVGEQAKIGSDLVSAGGSLEVRKGSTIGRDVVFATGQTLLGANVGRNVLAFTGGLQLDGDVAGNVKAEVGEASEARGGPPPTMFMSQTTVSVPIVKPGLTIDPAAKVGGNLQYTQNVQLMIPAGVVAGQITREPQPVREGSTPAPEKTDAMKVAEWLWNSIRSLVTLLLISLFLLWLFPAFTASVGNELESKPWWSLLWGAIAYAAFFFILLLIVFVTVLGGILFGVLTLGGLTATIIVLGIMAFFGVIVGFVLVTAFVAKVVFGEALGKWILTRANSPVANHRYWPTVIGVTILVGVVALLTFPLIPTGLGRLLEIAIILFGLGALALRIRGQAVKTPPPAAAA